MPVLEKEIDHALALIREKQFEAGTHGSQQHAQGNENRNALQDALTHPACRDCNHLWMVFPSGNPTPVVLRCKANHSPMALWQDWWAAEGPKTCPDCTDPAGRPR